MTLHSSSIDIVLSREPFMERKPLSGLIYTEYTQEVLYRPEIIYKSSMDIRPSKVLPRKKITKEPSININLLRGSL